MVKDYNIHKVEVVGMIFVAIQTLDGYTSPKGCQQRRKEGHVQPVSKVTLKQKNWV